MSIKPFKTSLLNVTQHIEIDQLGQMFKIDFCCFLNMAVLLSSILVLKNLNWTLHLLDMVICNFIDDVITQISEKLILKKMLLKFENLGKILAAYLTK